MMVKLRHKLVNLHTYLNAKMYFGRWNAYDFLFVLILIVSIVVRMQNYQFPFDLGGGDGTRDYLIANEILHQSPITENARPLVGPGNGLGLVNSPAYYYLLSFFLLFNNSFWFMNMANIFFQILTIVIIYVLVRTQFGAPPALLASILFSFDTFILRQALHMWQPFIMQPFLYFSYLLLYLAWKKKSHKLLYGSVFFTIFAGALHNSAFAILPTILLLSIYILWKQKKSKKIYIGLILTILFSILAMYGAPMVQLYSSYISSPQGLINSLQNNSINFSWNINLLSNLHILPQLVDLGTSSKKIMLLGFIAILFLVLLDKKFKDYIWFILIAFWLALQPLIALAWAQISGPLNTHYIALSSGLLYMVVAVILYKFCQLFDKLGKIFFVVIVAMFLYKVPLHIDTVRSQFAYTSNNEVVFNEALSAIENEIYELKRANKYENLDFFQMIALQEVDQQPPGGAEIGLFWLELEDRFEKEFVHTSHHGTFGTKNSNEHVFLICIENTIVENMQDYDCREDYYTRKVEKRRFYERDYFSFSKEIYSRGIIKVFVNEDAFPQEGM